MHEDRRASCSREHAASEGRDAHLPAGRYVELFEAQLSEGLGALGVSPEELVRLCEYLKFEADLFEEDADGIYTFLDSAAACERSSMSL